MTALLQAEKEFVAIAYDIRQKLSDADISGFTLQFSMSGRTATGELKYTVTIDDEYNYGNKRVTGNSARVVLEEFMRRLGWTKENAVLMLPSIKSDAVEVLENEVPF